MRLIDVDVAEILTLPGQSRVEADVRLVYTRAPGTPAQERIVRGSAALDDPRDRPVRVRLIADALQAALRAGDGVPPAKPAAA